MKSVTLLTVNMSGFKSYRTGVFNPTTEPGLKHLTGTNVEEPRLGANGIGKSSLLDAVFWCLYGVSLKGVRASDLVSWEGPKRPTVITDWQIDEDLFTISRVGNPDSLTIDGERVTQEDVDAILGLTREEFKHAVFFGQNVPFLVDVPIIQRGALLDSVLDLGIWLRAAEKAGEGLRELEREDTRLNTAVARLEGALDALPVQAELAAKQQEWDAEHKRELQDKLLRFATLAKVVDTLAKLHKKTQRAYDALEGVVEANAAITELRRDVTRATVQIREAQSDVDRATRQRKHMVDNPNCPTCKQAFPKATREQGIRALDLELAAALKARTSAGQREKTAEDALADAEKANVALVAKERELWEAASTAKGDLARAQRDLDALEKEVERFAAQKDNPFTKQLADAAARHADLLSQLNGCETELATNAGRVKQAKFWQGAFKRVRLFQMARVLKHLEIEVSNAARALGLIGWKITFATETETKSGSTKQGLQIIVTSPGATATWEAWSGGEAQRIRLAVAMGFAAMLQNMRGVRYTFEAWDEPTAGLSTEGIEDVLDKLRARADEKQLSVWLMDHRALSHTSFDEVWHIDKTNGASSIRRV